MNRCNHIAPSTWKKGQGQSGPAMFCSTCGKFIGYVRSSEPAKKGK